MKAQRSGRGQRRILRLDSSSGGLSPGLKTLLLFGVLGLLGVLFAVSNPEASLRHLQISILSGGVKGNYFAIVDRVAVAASRRKGRIHNLTSAGSVENVQRLIAARAGCSAHFALVQEGVEWPQDSGLEFVGRLPRPESLVVLGREADRISSPLEMRRMRVGIGPPGSGTESLMRRVLAPFSALEFQVSTEPIDEQIHKLTRGELDLGAMVIDEDAAQLREAVREQRLQILDFPRAEAVAHALPFFRVGRIEAGHYDLVSALPPTDKKVLQIDTLILGNGCASRTAVQALLGLLTETHPGFLKGNQETPNLTGLPYATAARSYYDGSGPDLVGVYVPWVVDIMPTANWVQLALGISVLFNAMGAWNRFRLWRIDAARVKLEKELLGVLGPSPTLGEIAHATPNASLHSEEARVAVRAIVGRLEALYQRCRKQSLSVLVPMGGEMAYRHQEALIHDLLQALRELGFRTHPEPVRTGPAAR